MSASNPYNFAEVQILAYQSHKISYRRLGSGSRKILFFHGFPGSSLQIELFRPVVEKLGVEVIALDRPGYGESSFDETEQFKLTENFALELTKHLGWREFEVFCVSGGTPSGLSFAHKHPELVNAISVACGLAPLANPEFRRLMDRKSVIGLRFARFIPGRLAKEVVAKQNNGSHPWLFNFFFPASRSDRLAMRDPHVSKSLELSLTEAFAQSGAGPKRDALTFLSDWGWCLKELKQPIAFWHGEEDKLVPPAMSKAMSEKIPHSRCEFFRDEGHFSLPISRIGDILGA